MGENDFRSISCEIMDRFRSSLLLVRSSVCPFVNNLQWVFCECTQPTLFGQLFWANSFETSQLIRSPSENVQMVSAQYLVKELVDLDHILHTY